MLLIGLTGSIATGKSTASAILSSPPHSLPLIDADLLAREVVLPGTRAYNRIVAHFGPSTPDLLLPASPPPPPPSTNSASGSSSSPSSSTPKSDAQPQRPLDRAALGRRVFGHSEERQRDRKVLNSIIHPAVRLAMARHILSYHLRGHWAVLLDIPLLYESGLDPFVGYVILIGASPEIQMQRLRARDPHLSEEDARDRVGSQMGMREKVQRTWSRGSERGVALWNDDGKEVLEKELGFVMQGLARQRKGWWHWWLWNSPLAAGVLGGWEVWRNWQARQRWEETERKKRVREREVSDVKKGKRGGKEKEMI